MLTYSCSLALQANTEHPADKTPLQVISLKAIKNIAFNKDNSVKIADAQAIKPIITLMKKTKSTRLRLLATDTLTNLTNSKAVAVKIGRAGAVSPLVRRLHRSVPTHLLASTLVLLQSLARLAANKTRIVAKEQGEQRRFFERLVALLTDRDNATMHEAVAGEIT